MHVVCSMRPDEAEMGWCVLNVSEWSGEGRKEKVWVHGAGEAHLGSSSFHWFHCKRIWDAPSTLNMAKNKT